MNTKRLLQIGGVINLLLVAFHLSFWKMFNWGQSLACLSPDDRAVMQVLNIHMAYTLTIFAIVSFVFPGELSATKLGRVISLAIAGFWILRGVNQLVFWGLSLAGSWIILVICLAVAALYLIPATRKSALGN
ncbi:MAG: hypothetical protein JW730_20165 [Anaerolineales bacterium]|nr:hypothetical protein [Anaerolineales bacterium]